MEKIWLKSYPPGVPAEIDVNEFRSLGELFERSVRRFADKTAYVCMGKSITYAELDALSARFGAFLQGALGLPKGTRVALMMPNVLQYPIALFGALRAGYTIVNVNLLYTARELEHQLKDAGAEAIVILENFAHTLEHVRAQVPIRHVIVTSLGEMLGFPKGAIVNFVVRRVRKLVPAWRLDGHLSFTEALRRGAAHALQPVDIGPEDMAFLQYTLSLIHISEPTRPY